MGPGGNPNAHDRYGPALTAQDMQNVALYLSQQPLKEPATAGHENLVEFSQKIWRGGLADRNVPACAACHGATGRAFRASIPACRDSFRRTSKNSLAVPQRRAWQ